MINEQFASAAVGSMNAPGGGGAPPGMADDVVHIRHTDSPGGPGCPGIPRGVHKNRLQDSPPSPKHARRMDPTD